MGDAGEGLIDADGRIQERMEELERERTRLQHGRPVRDPEKMNALETLRLTRTEIDRQFTSATNPQRRAQLAQALEEIDRRMREVEAGMKG